MKNSKILALALLTVFTFSSCNNDDPEVVNEEEVITTVTTTLTAGSSVITLTSRDLDGDGPNAPVITPVVGELKANTTYTGTTTFLNEAVTPADDITAEVKEEGDDHQLFYQAPVAVGTFTYLDADKNGKPIGLTFTLKTGATATTGNITVVLRHLPAKSASGVATGDITNAGGATDASVPFPVKVVN